MNRIGAVPEPPKKSLSLYGARVFYENAGDRQPLTIALPLKLRVERIRVDVSMGGIGIRGVMFNGQLLLYSGIQPKERNVSTDWWISPPSLASTPFDFVIPTGMILYVDAEALVYATECCVIVDGEPVE